jgi:hypothetical protein
MISNKLKLEDVKDGIYNIFALILVVPLFYSVVFFDLVCVNMKQTYYKIKRVKYHKIPSKFGYYVGRKD